MSKQNKRVDAKKRENFMLAGSVGDIEGWTSKTEEQISRDLFKGTDPEKIIDAFEEMHGIRVQTMPKANLAYKFVYLSPCSDEDDGELLMKFYNTPEQYQIIHRSDNWTPRGELKIFLEYYENLDVKLEKEEQKSNPTAQAAKAPQL